MEDKGIVITKGKNEYTQAELEELYQKFTGREPKLTIDCYAHRDYVSPIVQKFDKITIQEIMTEHHRWERVMNRIFGCEIVKKAMQLAKDNEIEIEWEHNATRTAQEWVNFVLLYINDNPELQNELLSFLKGFLPSHVLRERIENKKIRKNSSAAW